MAVCPNSSDYVASSLVNAFHSIPHRDINLGATTDSFELSLDYFQVSIGFITCLWFLRLVVCLTITKRDVH